MKNFKDFLETSHGRIIQDNMDLTIDLIKNIPDADIAFCNSWVQYMIANLVECVDYKIQIKKEFS